MRRFLGFLSICFVGISWFVQADVLREPAIVKINGVSVYEDVARKVFKDAKDKHLDIIGVKTTKDSVGVIRDTEVIINGSKLMDEMVKLYGDIISSNESPIGYKNSEEVGVVVIVDREKRIITSIILNN